jgi:tRNA(fMet)-specific endonuclease VapC
MLRFLDTDTCVAYLRGTSVRVRDRLLKQSRSTIALPAIVMAELLFGLEKSTQRQQRDSVIQQFVRTFRIVPFAERAAEHYARIRALLESKGQPIGANDYLIAATVLAEKGILVTGNTGEFKRVPGLKLENWLGV